ncbi:MAG: ATP-binding domain-containing protein [Proteobacteria bacterium]|nr:ATP-binding domain-containing protein [Pseudomonadota bacterium]
MSATTKNITEDFAEKSRDLKLTEFLEYVIKNTGLEEHVRDGTERGEERWDNVRELLSVCAKYNEEEPRQAIRMLVEEAALAQEADNVEYEKDLVNLMTLHATKGLEFSVVFIAGCEQGLLPHSRALSGANEEELEEERRLCYVGVTRAKEKLYLSFAQRRMMFGKTQSNPPSEFLQHIPERLIEFIPAEEENVIELD